MIDRYVAAHRSMSIYEISNGLLPTVLIIPTFVFVVHESVIIAEILVMKRDYWGYRHFVIFSALDSGSQQRECRSYRRQKGPRIV